jgi:hypothetical protein
MAAANNSAKLGRGKWKVMYFPKTASAAICSNSLVEFASGYVKQATTTAGATDTPLAGIYIGPEITSGSSNYATTEKVPVLVPEGPTAEALLVVGTGSLTAAMVGQSYDIDADAEVTVSTTSNEPVTCTEYISATSGMFALTLLSAPAA